VTARQPLLATLRAAHLRLGLAAVIAAGVVLTLVSFVTLRSFVDHNLALVARSISYTAEAATVFGDAGSAQEVLETIVARESLLAARIADRTGRPLAAYQLDSKDSLKRAASSVATMLFSPQASAPIVHEGQQYGVVVVDGDGTVYLAFLLNVLAAIGLCTAAIAVLVSRQLRRIERDIIQPLNRLASLTRRARTERALDLRAPAAVVKEIHELGDDFNALLGEVQSREARLVAKHDTLRTANESLSYLAFHDSLTGLPNRASLLERLGTVLHGRGVHAGKAALLYLDGDRFKAINDELGHAAGDELLIEIARRIRSGLRDTDFVARLGGDEFAVLLSPIRDVDDAAKIAVKIAAAVGAPFESANFGPIESGVSVGVAMFPDHGEDVDQLLAAADAAMYRAKSQRRGSVAVFDTDVDDVTRPMVA
jgi:diguanylate cyclase